MNTDRQSVASWLKYDARTSLFVNVMQFVNWERVEGDILEFGISVGKSLGLLGLLYRENLAHWGYTDPACTGRRVAGFDSFVGLPKDDVFHPRWEEGSFAKNYLADHPFLKYDEPITPQSIRAIFSACEMPEPEIEQGWFKDTLPSTIASKYRKAAIVHIDSDLYQSAKDVLNAVEPILQDGTILLFDDWFMYKGDPNQGEQRAFREFLEEHSHWQAIHYAQYSVFCNSFILHRR